PGLAMNPGHIMGMEERRNIGAIIPDNLLALLLGGKKAFPVVVDQLSTEARGFQAVRPLAIAKDRAGLGTFLRFCKHLHSSVLRYIAPHQAATLRFAISMKVSTRVFNASMGISSCSVSTRRWGIPWRSKASLISG